MIQFIRVLLPFALLVIGSLPGVVENLAANDPDPRPAAGAPGDSALQQLETGATCSKRIWRR